MIQWLIVVLLLAPVTALSAPCGKITASGCCTGAVVSYCKAGILATRDCAKDTKYGKESC